MRQQDLLMLSREVGSYDGAVRLVSNVVSRAKSYPRHGDII
jgi:hypothetical protein